MVTFKPSIVAIKRSLLMHGYSLFGNGLGAFCNEQTPHSKQELIGGHGRVCPKRRLQHGQGLRASWLPSGLHLQDVHLQKQARQAWGKQSQVHHWEHWSLSGLHTPGSMLHEEDGSASHGESWDVMRLSKRTGYKKYNIDTIINHK